MPSFLIVKPGHKGTYTEPDEAPFSMEPATYRCPPARAMRLHLCACGGYKVLSHMSSCKVEALNTQLYWNLQNRVKGVLDELKNHPGMRLLPDGVFGELVIDGEA